MELRTFILRIIKNEVFRYLVVGVCTTLVNLVSFAILCYLLPLGGSATGITVANTISVALAILFAYFANKYAVFKSKTSTIVAMFSEMMKFCMARLSSMIIEVGGVWLLVSIINQDAMLAKIETQFIVVVCNYFISKWLVFTK